MAKSKKPAMSRPLSARRLFYFGQDLTGVVDLFRVKSYLHLSHGFDILRGENEEHLLHLLRTDAMFTTDGAARIRTQLKDLRSGQMNLSQLLFIPLIEQDQGMKIPIPCMEDIGDGEVISLPDLDDLAQNLREFRPRNSPITDQVVRPQPGHGAKSPFPTCPKLGPLR